MKTTLFYIYFLYLFIYYICSIIFQNTLILSEYFNISEYFDIYTHIYIHPCNRKGKKYLSVTKQASSVCVFQFFYLKLEIREACSVRPRYCL